MRGEFISPVPLAPMRERLSWALYDFANTVFSMNIATLYFAAWLVADLGQSNTTYAIANGIASALVVISIPIFGALSDATQRRKPWVVGFTILASAATIVMAAIGERALPLLGEEVVTPSSAGASDARNSAALAISGGSPPRFSGFK